MIKSIVLFSFFSLVALTGYAQEDELIKVISREVEGEVRTLDNDTLYGTIKVREATEKHITTIFFKEKGNKKVVYSGHNIKRFKMIVPFPDRPSFGVEELYYQSHTDPKNPQKKYFVPLDEWK